MTSQIKHYLEKFASALRHHSIPFNELYLFGSAARGTMRQWSDIDVGVVGPSFGKDRIEEIVKLRGISYSINPAISPMPLRPEDLTDKFSPIGDAIRREGVKVK